MDFISVGQEARGFIAIGQHATGVFAFGQIATGVVAVGQVARGCFTLGQVAAGFIGWGQVGFGILHAVGMLGAGGRGFGIVLRLVPGIGKKRVPPQTISMDRAYGGEDGFVAADLFWDGESLGLGSNGQRLPVKLSRKLIVPGKKLVATGAVPVFAHIRRIGPTLVCERIVHEPPRPYERSGFYSIAAFQLAGLFVLACAWWIAVGNELMVILGEAAEGIG